MATECEETENILETIISKESDSALVTDENSRQSDELSENKETVIETVRFVNSNIKSEAGDSPKTEVSSTENGKKRTKEDKPLTKIVVRRLPPTMTEENFLEQVSPVPPYDYMYFVQGDPLSGIFAFSRAYLNFMNQEDILTFTQTFDNYIFFDSKGQEYPAIVEFAPFQRMPKQRVKKRDPLCGTIECDSQYITFKENLEVEALENAKPGSIAKQHYFETEISAAEEVNTTPLLEFLKQRRADKARIRDERREEKKRKDSERKLKQKAAKDKKTEEDEESKDVKMQCYSFSSEKLKNQETDSSINRYLKENARDNLSRYEMVLPFKQQMKVKSQPMVKEKSKQRNENVLNSVSCDKFKMELNAKDTPCSIRELDCFEKSSSSVSSDKKINDKSKFTAVSNLDNKRLEIGVYSTRDKIFEMLEYQKAEQQTQYLRQLLGVTSSDKIQDKTKVQISPSSQYNINPSLPSASFKSSCNSNILLPTPQSGNATFLAQKLDPKIDLKDPIDVATLESKLVREVIIDKALSTDNLLPSAFKKSVNKST